ncbi:MAG: pyruvate formate lyase family protein [Desulfatibacillaceae bacterium]
MSTNSLSALLAALYPGSPMNLLSRDPGIAMDTRVDAVLRLFAAQFSLRPGLRRRLRVKGGWLDFSVGFTTDSDSVARTLVFEAGRARVRPGVDNARVTLCFVDEAALASMLGATPYDTWRMMLENRLCIRGDTGWLQVFNHLVSRALGRLQNRVFAKERRQDADAAKAIAGACYGPGAEAMDVRRAERLSAPSVDPGVRFLEDPWLAGYGLEDFPRLSRFLSDHFDVTPEVCAERPALLTEFYREHGFFEKPDGRPWNPVLRQAEAFAHLMVNKKPLVAEGDLLGGSTTAKLPCGVVLYPDAQGGLLWGELDTVDRRLLNPYRISEQTKKVLHEDVFPYFADKNFWKWVHDRYSDPLCQRINDRSVAYFVWKMVGISHTIPDYGALLDKGLSGIHADIAARLVREDLDREQRDTLVAMQITLHGVIAYAKNLSREAARLARREKDPERAAELVKISRIYARVPEQAPETLHEALCSLWVVFVALHMENTNTAISWGRLDRLLQPFFERDMEALDTQQARKAYEKRALELVGCLMMRCTDHLPLVPDAGNYLFGGSSSDQAITLGGVDEQGRDAVCDMTYVFLKATEMLCIRDPNVNARFSPGVNGDAYLARLCDVNFRTAATPSMHNDAAVEAALAPHGYPIEHIRDWSATGCVEPTLSGRHMGHTGSVLMNMVAALEMALYNGRHPLMRWDVGPKTGDPAAGDFPGFEDFFAAWRAQQEFLIEQAVEYNRMLAEAHVQLRPTPFLSSLVRGCVDKALDATRGGAMYNTSGTSNIGLADVADSLAAVKRLVYEEKVVTFAELRQTLEDDFASRPDLAALLRRRGPRFGSGDPQAVAMANRVAKAVHDAWAAHTNHRGGRYTTGFWSMSQHVAYGNLSGALPSGRPAGKAFTPGLTPSPEASPNFLDNMLDVASLAPENMDNNIAFNVKLVPAATDGVAKTVETMAAYVRAYFQQGGMQMQFNVVNSETLKKAMLHPENYRNLLVRISGYNAYFVTLNREMQLELIERAQYGL